MADGFIVRRGGVSDATPAPTISFVSKTEDSVTFTITNNSLKARDITYGLTTPPTTTTINLAGGATSTNQTINDITEPFITIYAQAEDSAITEFRVRFSFPLYTAATGGTTLEYNLDGKRYRSHTFTSDGDFIVTTAGNGDRNQVDYLIIAGGGSAYGDYGGGGGAGGYRTTLGTQGGLGTLDSKITVTATTYPIVIGAGGASGDPGNNGVNSSGLGITSTGGGRGGRFILNRPGNGVSGGSGGGGALRQSNKGGAGTSGQGFAGGNAIAGTTSGRAGSGGGGGAGSVGQNGTTAGSGVGGNGGDGLANLLRTGSLEFRAGGGGGAGASTNGNGGLGGGGGAGGSPTAGTANTGGGAGGSQSGARSGGSGIVIVRYEIAPSV